MHEPKIFPSPIALLTSRYITKQCYCIHLQPLISTTHITFLDFSILILILVQGDQCFEHIATDHSLHWLIESMDKAEYPSKLTNHYPASSTDKHFIESVNSINSSQAFSMLFQRNESKLFLYLEDLDIRRFNPDSCTSKQFIPTLQLSWKREKSLLNFDIPNMSQQCCTFTTNLCTSCQLYITFLYIKYNINFITWRTQLSQLINFRFMKLYLDTLQL